MEGVGIRQVVRTRPRTGILDVIVAGHVLRDDCDIVLVGPCEFES